MKTVLSVSLIIAFLCYFVASEIFCFSVLPSGLCDHVCILLLCFHWSFGLRTKLT